MSKMKFTVKKSRAVAQALFQSIRGFSAQNKMQRAVLLDVVGVKRLIIHKLLAGEDEALLVRFDAFLVLDLSLDSRDGVGAAGLDGDSFAGQSPDKDLHAHLIDC
jgi:hypothetical protein